MLNLFIHLINTSVIGLHIPRYVSSLSILIISRKYIRNRRWERQSVTICQLELSIFLKSKRVEPIVIVIVNLRFL